MAAPTRAPRTRASGGRTLMLLGVLLALAAGTIVIYIVSQATTGSAATVTVVVATQPIPEGKILSVDTADTTHVRISDYFTTKAVPQSIVPPNARPWVSQDDLNIYLNDQVVVGQFYQGDILQQQDPRLVKVGTGAANSLTLVNPGMIKKGQVLFEMDLAQTSAKPIAVPGDYIDVLAVACNLKANAGCEAQTTVQNLYVYAVQTGSVIVVTDRKTAEELMLLKQSTSQLEMVVRGSGDTDTAPTLSPVNNGTIINDFHF